MSYSYKTAISFGLIYIPVTLHSVVKNNDIGFNMLDKNTMSRIQYKKTCVDCDNREVRSEDIVKGYQYEKDKYVIFQAEDFEKIMTKKDKSITILQFVEQKEIDPIYYDKPYYVMPTSAEKAYKLLVDAMTKEKKVGIAKTVLGTKETLIALHAKNGELLLSTLYFHDEITANPAKQPKVKTSEKELELAKLLIKSMTDKFDITTYKNEYREKLQKAIDAKISGQEIISPKEVAPQKVASLLDALKKSLKEKKVV